MQVNLEIQSGSLAGKRLAIQEGETVTVGRTENANFAIPEDTFLSRVHFAVECNGVSCRVIDRRSANGTFVNGQKITKVAIQDGDEIVAGKTRFRVCVTDSPALPSRLAEAAASISPPPSGHVTEENVDKQAAVVGLQTPVESGSEREMLSVEPAAGFESTAAQIGSWFFGIIPPGWSVVEGVGLRRLERGAFLSEVTVSDETLAPGQTFSQYVESQIEMLRLFVSHPEIVSAESPAISGAEETKTFVVRYKTDDGPHFVQRQIYACHDRQAGSLALTTTENDLPRVQPYFDQILHGATFAAQP